MCDGLMCEDFMENEFSLEGDSFAFYSNGGMDEPLGYDMKQANEKSVFEGPALGLAPSDELRAQLDLLESNHNLSVKGGKTNEEWFDYYSDKADEAFEKEDWHYDRAEKASARGDEEAAKDHIERAKAWHDDGEDFLKTARIYKSK